MKLLFITHTSSIYGANRSLLDLIECTQKNGHEAHVIIPRKGPIEALLIEKNIPYSIYLFFPLTYPKHWSFLFQIPKYFIKAMLSCLNLYRILSPIKRYKPDIIYSNSLDVWYGIISSRLLRIKHIFHVREYFENYNLEYPFHKNMLTYFFKYSSSSTFISNALQKHYAPHLKNRNFHVIYNGLYVKKDIPKTSRTTFSKDPFIISIIGQLSKSKGQHIAIEGFSLFLKHYPNSRLNIIGAGSESYTQSLKSTVHDLNIEQNITFTGLLSDVSDYYRKSACTLVCSPLEAFGRIVIESFYHGTPVIGRNSGALPELIQDGYNGYLFDGSPEDLYLKLESLYLENISYEALSKHALECLKRTFNKDIFQKEIHLQLTRVVQTHKM